MTRKRYDELTPAARRRMVMASLLRSAASVTLLVTLYYLAPLDHSLDTGTWIWFGLGLVVFAAVSTWQVRRVIVSDTPRLRAIEAASVGLPLLLLLFAATYFVIAGSSPDSFTQALGRTDALYFTVTVFSTVGFGDIAPRSEVARILTMVQMITGLVAVGLVAKIILGAVEIAVRRREAADPAQPDTAPGPDATRPEAARSTRPGDG